MSVEHILFQILLEPLVLLFEFIYGLARELTGQSAVAIIWLSLVVNLLCLPLYQRADAISKENREQEKRMEPWVKHIKSVFKGDERFLMLQAYYRICHYNPLFVFKNFFSLLLQIPFFIVAYRLLSGMTDLQGQSLGPIANLGAPDGLLVIGGTAINVLPIIMTIINLGASSVYFDDESWWGKIQFYGIALIFLFLLYNSASGLVFYWTLNQVFSLIKNIINRFADRNLTMKIMTIASIVISISLLAWFGLRRGNANLSALALVVIPAAIFIFIAYKLIAKHWSAFAASAEDTPGDTRLFFLGGAVLSVAAGLLIPSAVICSSPEEFISVYAYVSPLYHVLNSLLIAFGLFIFWLGIFYYIADRTGRRLFTLASCGFSICAVADYMFFGTGLGLLTPELRFEKQPSFSNGIILANEAVLAVLFFLVFFLWLKRKKVMASALSIALIVLGGMSVLNLYDIYDSLPQIEKMVKQENSAQPSYALSRTGKNVIVLMLDRAISGYVPYLFNEKPELKRQFAGFTFYPNTISYGHGTNNGSPGLYGGYEYRPEEMNKRTELTLPEKHDEALKLMPVLFNKDGFDVTVCNPSYAGYSNIPDLSIYNDYPGIKAFNTEQGQMRAYLKDMPEGISESGSSLWERNFFCYSVMKMSPVAVQMLLYQDGKYFDSNSSLTNFQITKNKSVAYGINQKYLNSYSVLCAMPDMLKCTDDKKGGFLLLCNETPHQPVLLQEPSYSVSLHVNNTKYDKKHSKRFKLRGRKCRISNHVQMRHYHANMATFMALGEWLDYLREQGVYDNTRIIMVSDHGYPLKSFADMRFFGKNKKDLKDAMWYNALLMVKDFNSDKEFTTDNTFMTNADTPSLAFQGVIDSPVNPFTGKAINTDAKKEKVHHIFYTNHWRIKNNRGKKFKPGNWYALHGDNVFDSDSWEFLGSY